MIAHRGDNGFTVVELLVAIVIGVLLMGVGSQAYSVALTNAGTAQRRAKASNMAYDLLRQSQSSSDAVIPCTPKSATSIALPDPSALPGATAARTITCPLGASSQNLVMISITVSYSNPEQRSVTRAIIFAP